MHTHPIAAGLAIAAVALGGCGGSSSTSGSQQKKATTSTIDIKGFKFKPATVTVAVGSSIRFTNSDRAEHTATENGAAGFDTGALHAGQSRTVKLAKAGTFSYRCDFHPFMTGEVVVNK